MTDAVRAVGQSAEQPRLHVASIEAGARAIGGRYRVGPTIVVQDALGAPVSNADVTVWVDMPRGGDHFGPEFTDDGGVATGSSMTPIAGTSTFTVTDVRRPGWTYDPAANGKTSASVTIP